MQAANKAVNSDVFFARCTREKNTPVTASVRHHERVQVNLENIFEEVSKQIKSDFEKFKNALNHAGLKGASNEEIVKGFLRQPA